MELVCHGGDCCGMKTIKHFASQGSGGLNAIAAELLRINQIHADHCHAGQRFFHEAAPKETQLERLDRYLAYLDKHRRNGICEVVLADYKTPGAGDQTPVWRPVLEERGFKEVSSCHNSNSGNRIFVFHRVKDKEEKAA